MPPREPSSTRALTPQLRALYAAAAALAVGAAVLTYVLTERTDDFFAWPIQPPLSAAFLGACYLAATTLLLFASRPQSWAEGRLPAVPVMAISILLLATTLIHWDRFEQGHPVFWFWLAAYVLVPPVLLVLVLDQRRRPGGDPPPRAQIPGWARAGLVAHAVILLGLGALMFAAPGTAEDFWPWALSDLTSRALGAFIFGFGAIAAFVVHDDELMRLQGPALAYAVLGAAQLIAVARYSDDVDFDDPAAWIYIAFVASMLLGGLAILAVARRRSN